MSQETTIDKLDFETIEHEKVPFTLIHTTVIQKISDHFAGFIWVYLHSLPSNWKINKKHLLNHFNIGECKLKVHLAYLNKTKLIEYQRPRLPDGTLGKITIRVLNGMAFNENYDVTNRNKTKILPSTTGMENHPVVEPPAGGSPPLTNTIDITNTKKETNTPNPTGFDLFWKNYPVKTARAYCLKIWKRKRLEPKSDQIIQSVELNLEKNEKWKAGFVPNPATFLNQERWDDELTLPNPQPQANQGLAPVVKTEIAIDIRYNGFMNDFVTCQSRGLICKDAKSPNIKLWESEGCPETVTAYAKKYNIWGVNKVSKIP